VKNRALKIRAIRNRTFNKLVKLSIALLGISFFSFTTALAQETNDESADVWSVVEAQWAAEEKGDKLWLERLLTDDFAAWGKNSPAPRGKSSTQMWDRFTDQQGEMVAHELYPLSIVVHGDMAVAHYLYTSAYEDKKGEVEISNGRYSDILVRTEDGWKFISWHGGDDE
jgi:ketosteroid isomerase-like protein